MKSKLLFCVGVMACALMSCARSDYPNLRVEEDMPDDFVIVNQTLSNIEFDIRYFGYNNFVGEKITGYKAPFCILHEKVAKALANAAEAAQREGYRLKIFDCYRPQRAVDHFVRWASDLQDKITKADYYPNIAKASLLGPYIAEKSGHSRGASVDLTLQRRNQNGQWHDLDMGTAFDFFDAASNTFNPATDVRILENRKRLIRYMEAGDFVNYDMEWWHFSYPDQPYPDTYFNFLVD